MKIKKKVSSSHTLKKKPTTNDRKKKSHNILLTSPYPKGGSIGGLVGRRRGESTGGSERDKGARRINANLLPTDQHSKFIWLQFHIYNIYSTCDI